MELIFIKKKNLDHSRRNEEKIFNRFIAQAIHPFFVNSFPKSILSQQQQY